jgi:hypothetical protein
MRPRMDDDAGRRERLRELTAAVDRILREADPIGLIAIGAPQNEYQGELRTIVPRLSESNSATDVQRIVHEEFVRWFGARTAGPASRYAALSRRIWEAWAAFNAKR